MANNIIRIGETFLSVQGEGSTVGRLSLFIRVTGCTLDCKWCDSVSVWKTKGVPYTPQDLAKYVRATYEDSLEAGAQIVLTGGSPLLQQEGLASFLQSLGLDVEVEVETEGVLLPLPMMDMLVTRYNVSPKLANSGMPLDRRQKLNVLNWHVNQGGYRSIFKFVVSNEQDVLEVDAFRRTFGVLPSKIWLMPCVSTQEEHATLAPTIAAYAKVRGYNFSPRLQVVLWNMTLGV